MVKILHKVGYNSQRDNDSFNGKFSGNKQCFSTCAYMLLSWISPIIHKSNDDKMLAMYVSDASDVVCKTGIGADMEKINKYSANSAYFWEVHKKVLETVLSVEGKVGKIIYRDANANWDVLYSALKDSPVIIGTEKLGGLSGGHIILAIGANEKGELICHDPYGDANANYKNKNGDSVTYSCSLLAPAIGISHIRCMWWEGDK